MSAFTFLITQSLSIAMFEMLREQNPFFSKTIYVANNRKSAAPTQSSLHKSTASFIEITYLNICGQVRSRIIWPFSRVNVIKLLRRAREGNKGGLCLHITVRTRLNGLRYVLYGQLANADHRNLNHVLVH